MSVPDESVTFLVDAVVTHLELKGINAEPQNLNASIKFPQRAWKMGASRINVTDFAPNREQQIVSNPSRMRDDLEEKGIIVGAIYNGSTLGTATMSFPQEFLDKISLTMNDLLHVETLQLMRRTDVVGSVTIMVRLTIKCEKDRDSITTKISDRHTINPQDVMFTIGDPDPVLEIPSNPCSELAEAEGDKLLRLDLARYSSMKNSRVVLPDDLPCLKEKPSLRQLKEITRQFTHIVDSVSTKVKQNDCWSPVVPTEEPLEKSSFLKSPPQEHWIPVPIKNNEEYGVKPIRFCPICLCSMSWLPKYASCPRCQTTTRPFAEETVSDLQTADQIMNEQLVRPQAAKGVEDFCQSPCEAALKDHCSEDECPPCRCTCTLDKICAHCRIRKLCEDIYHVPSSVHRIHPKAKSDEDYSVITDADMEDDRPYLARVFSELKNLYDLHDSKKQSDLEKRCNSSALLFRHSSNHAPGQVKPRAVRSLPACAIGTNRPKHVHKRCLPTECIVSRRHGWNWTKTLEARNNGWRPGAILSTSGHVMRYFLNRRDKYICQKALSDYQKQKQLNPPMLNIFKRRGEIFITLHPQESMIGRQKPIVFRIVKSDLAVALRQIKRALKDLGFPRCICHKSLMLCTCRDALEKIELNKALKKECHKRNMPPCPEHLVLTDTSDSDVDFEMDVTPPCRPRKKVLSKMMNHSTQTSIRDRRPPPPKYPKQISPYYMRFDCAVGDRYMGTAMGRPGEEVFEDGLFGLLGGGPHGPNPMPCGRHRLAAAWGKGGGFNAMFGGGRGSRARGLGGVIDGLPGADKLFPKTQTGPIPVRYPKRFLKPGQDAAKAALQAEKDAIMKKKKGIDMIKYLQKEGTLTRPWNPDEGKDTRPKKSKFGPDGLTDGQRKRMLLLSGPAPLLCQIPRRGKGYNPCNDSCFYPYVDPCH
ncbi:hypothetical protein KR067_011680 [Drosophila pandora]|nr:hypothetical protein KR067_011680 [Drosophila pandora]